MSCETALVLIVATIAVALVASKFIHHRWPR